VIPYGRQDVTPADLEAVLAVLKSDFLTQGPAIPAFERAVMERVGARHAIASSSATAALHIACLALGLRPGARLWTVPNTFVASANCARYCGADVDFVDIDSLTWNISVAKLREKLVSAKRSGTLPAVVVPVHFAGQPTEQEEIWELAREFGFRVLEDASHAIGASRGQEPVGSCRWSDITVFSFHPVKIITSGEGGMSLTNDAALAERMSMLRTHGITRDPGKMSIQAPPAWHYEQLDLGFNYRMTDIQAALGSSQMARLSGYITRRNELARRYDRLLSHLPLQLPCVRPGNVSAFHLYVVRLKPEHRKSHRAVFEDMRKLGIGVNLHYMPVHLQPYYRQMGFSSGQFPEAEAHGAQAITLPLYPTLTDAQQDEVVRCLERSLDLT
jgi:UDP-4-amino-4,6-dideoxy-N-acetyl-beta-L-altrosamine transaminase